MANDALFCGWNRPIPGREHLAVEVFGQWTSYLEKQKASGNVESYEHMFVLPHGGDMNGFTIIRGERAKLDQMRGTEEYYELLTRIGLYCDGFGVVPGFIGDNIMKQLGRYTKAIPK
jgi:hypothetical protein